MLYMGFFEALITAVLYLDKYSNRSV